MCGVFGFITTQGEGPDVSILRKVALVTETRGKHAFGLAWVDADGSIHSMKMPGPARQHLRELDRVASAVAMIGHCRYATHGLPADNRNNHPHPAGTGFLVHNGVIHNHLDLARQYRLRLRTQCDSEVLGLLLTKCAGSIAQRSLWVAEQVAGDLAILGLWRRPARLLVCRRGRPLHYGQVDGAYYFASLAEELPGRVAQIGDGSTRVLKFDGGKLRLDGPALGLGLGHF